MSTTSSHTVKAVFTFKDNVCKDKFIEFANGEKGLSVTRNWKGCQSIDVYEEHSNHLSVVIWQKWDSKEDHESYVKFRHDDGSFDFLGDLISCPPVIESLRPVVFKTDEEQIRDIIQDMCNKDHNLAMKHMSDDCLFIRPTGNPLTKEGWDNMMKKPEFAVSVELSELVSINRLHVCGDMAWVCYTNHSKFNYSGNSNDDIAVFTSVLQRMDGKWVVVHGQRSTGRNPSEELPKF
tara:strand:+ start:2548 stop:3252 length:705 start_codon:yes stop_codon:yes gene_type:complete